MDGQDRVVIRARGLGGYWIPIGLGFTLAWGVLMAFVAHIAANPVAFRLWLIVLVISVVSTIGFELIVRRTFVELADGRIRYFFREQSQRGDRPVAAVRNAYKVEGSGMIVFDDGESAILRGDLFASRDIERLVARIQQLNPRIAGAGS